MANWEFFSGEDFEEVNNRAHQYTYGDAKQISVMYGDGLWVIGICKETENEELINNDLYEFLEEALYGEKNSKEILPTED